MVKNVENGKKLPVSKHVIRVIWDGEKANVFPPTLYVRTGDTVYFYAKGSDMSVIIPKDLLPVKGKTPRNSNLKFNEYFIEAGSHDKPIKVKEKVEDRTDFPYAIYCEEANDFVKGNSPPEMIIEPEG